MINNKEKIKAFSEERKKATNQIIDNGINLYCSLNIIKNRFN